MSDFERLRKIIRELKPYMDSWTKNVRERVYIDKKIRHTTDFESSEYQNLLKEIKELNEKDSNNIQILYATTDVLSKEYTHIKKNIINYCSSKDIKETIIKLEKLLDKTIRHQIKQVNFLQEEKKLIRGKLNKEEYHHELKTLLKSIKDVKNLVSTTGKSAWFNTTFTDLRNRLEQVEKEISSFNWQKDSPSMKYTKKQELEIETNDVKDQFIEKYFLPLKKITIHKRKEEVFNELLNNLYLSYIVAEAYEQLILEEKKLEKKPKNS